MNADIWLAVGTGATTFVLLIAPVLVYAWYVLEQWIDDPENYARAMSKVN